jgi:hypothetical protein
MKYYYKFFFLISLLALSYVNINFSFKLLCLMDDGSFHLCKTVSSIQEIKTIRYTNDFLCLALDLVDHSSSYFLCFYVCLHPCMGIPFSYILSFLIVFKNIITLALIGIFVDM